MRSVWRHQPGRYFCVSTKSPWKDHFFTRDELRDVADFVGQQRGKNVYFCPHGFTRPKRVKEYAVAPTLLWADLDEVDPHTLKFRPTIAIQSSPGRFAAVWECDGPVSEELNQALTYRIGADRSGWDFTQVLRMPGTRNHKYSPAPLVKVLWDEGPDYRVADIERWVGPITRPQNAVRGPSAPVAAVDWKQVIAKYPRSGLRKYMGWCAEGKRSDVIYVIGRTLHEMGASRDEIAAVVAASSAWKSKWGEGVSRRLIVEVDRIISKRRAA